MDIWITDWSRIVGLPENAQVTDIYLKDVIKCQEIYGNWVKSYDKVICAGNFWKTVKPGDSGGPLLVKFNNKHYLVGIVSAGKNTFAGRYDQETNPALFTRMKSECEFLEKHTNFTCYNTQIPLRESDEEKHVCGHSMSFTNGSTLHPWYCRIYNDKGVDFCAATLISYRHAVTAAHCFKSMFGKGNSNFKSYYVKCGLKNQTQHLSKVKQHPNYHPRFIKNDIAVLEFGEKLNFDGATYPICLPKKNENLSPEMIAVGMNHNHEEHIFGKRSVSEFPVQRFDKDLCISRLVILKP